MTKLWTAPLMVVAGLVLSGCLAPNPGIGPNGELPVIARPTDHGIDSVPLSDVRDAAIVYDPDGCQAWLLDDGVEGYVARRRDAATGLPICDDRYPPGTVVGSYETRNAGLSDWVPTPAYGPLTPIVEP